MSVLRLMPKGFERLGRFVRPPRRSRLFFLAWSCVLAVAATGAEVPPAGIEYLQSEYIVDSWETEQGLPDNSINAITQTPEGYLWLATFNGLARFNGVEFVVFDAANTPELGSSRITDLKLDRKGRLWIRSEDGRVSQWAEGRFKTFPQGGGSTNQGILVVWEDHAGDIWASPSSSSTSYYHFANGVFEPANSTNTFYHRFGKGKDIQGHGWGIRSNRLFSVHPQDPVEVPIPGFRPPQGSRLAAASDGSMWLIAHRIQKFRKGCWEDYGALPRATDLFGGYLEDRKGNLWIGTGVGELWRVGTNRVSKRFKLPNDTTSELGNSICEDAEGNLWIGNRGSGLVRLKPRALRTYDSRDGLKSDVVRSVTQDRDGNIWLATVNSVDWFPCRSDADRAEPRGLTVSLPWNVHGARDGTVWIGTFSKGLFRFDGQNGTWFEMAGRSGASPLNVIFEDCRGRIHLGTPRGLYRVESDALVRCAQPEGSMDVRAIAEDDLGHLYVGLNGEGLVRKTKMGWDRFAAQDGFAARHVWALYVDQDDAVWVGTHGHGLSRFKNGKFFNFLEGDLGLPRLINCILEDDTGHLWFGSNQGLFRAERRQLNALADGRVRSAEVTHYDQRDGMGSSQCTGSGRKGCDGKLWFATMGGVTVADPRALPFNARPPPVVVEGVRIDDKSVSAKAATVKVPPGSRRLEFRYAGLSFAAPDRVRFQYRLHGFDEDWVKANNRFAYYTKVPPGEYRFQVIAANKDNVWNNTGASLAVVVEPYFWQTGWFRILSALVLFGSAAGFVRYLSLVRLRRRLAELERRHALENERGRIARDLHDHLGADLSQLALWSELAAREKDRPENMVDRVRSVSSLAREVIQNVDEIVWTMNPKNDSLERFAGYVCEFSERLLTGAGLRFRWEAPDKIAAVPLSSDVRYHLFLVTKEALNNVVKHANATEARVELSHANGDFVLTISDNGRGFDASAPSPASTGNGLANMHERMIQCGGKLTMKSQNGAGTTIRMRVPLFASSEDDHEPREQKHGRDEQGR